MLTVAKRVVNAVRLAEVIEVLLKHGFVDLVRRTGLHESLPARLLRRIHLIEARSGEPETLGLRLRAMLTELGPTFIKLGQVLSTRPDIVGIELSEEFSLLQDHVAPVPFEKLEAVFEQELGGKVADLFDEFNPEPVASASLSQVYQARLKSGEPVAVKIQRPDVEPIIESDLSLLERLAEWSVDHLEEVAWLDPPAVIDEFARSIRRELDLRVEARVLQRFADNFAGAAEFLVPHTYPDLSSHRVLTMDWVDGVRVDALDEYAARRCDPKIVARLGSEILCQQIFKHHLFHADPHPGNIFITHDNQIALLDYGMIGHMERTDAAALAEVLRAMFSESPEGCVDALLLLAQGDPENRQALEHEIADFIAFEGRSIVAEGRISDGLERLVNILRHNHLQLAPRFSLLIKALATIESVAHTLDRAMDIVAIIQPYAERLVRSRYAPWRVMRELEEGLMALVKLWRHFPADVEQLMRTLQRGRLMIELNHEGLDHLSNVTDRASNRIAFGVITGSLVVGSSLLMMSGRGTTTLGIIGLIIAAVLGASVLVSILRSKNY